MHEVPMKGEKWWEILKMTLEKNLRTAFEDRDIWRSKNWTMAVKY